MSTRYEITAKHTDGRAYLVGYIARRSHRGLTQFLTSYRIQVAIADATGLTGDTHFSFWSKPHPHWKCLAGWTIGFTGRTFLDAQREGELPTLALAIVQRHEQARAMFAAGAAS
jgi:hypothetical protein